MIRVASPTLPGWVRDRGGRGALRRTEEAAGKPVCLVLTPRRRNMGRYQSDGREIYGWSWEVSAFACQGARVEWSGYCYGEDPAYAAAEAIRVVPRVRAAAAVLGDDDGQSWLREREERREQLARQREGES